MADDTTTQPSTPAPTPPPSSGDQALGAASQEVSQQHTALPAPMPSMPHRIDRASGLLGMLTMDITNAYAAHKEKKIRDAMGTYMAYANAHSRAEDMVNKSGVTDPEQRKQMMQKFVSVDPSVVNIFSGKNGEKNVKAMRDILKVDFSDPESMNTVQHQALQRVTKALGVQKVMAMFGMARQQHAQQGQQPGQQPGRLPGAMGAGGQLNQQPTDPGARNVATRAESQATPIPTDVKGATEIAKAESELTTSRANMVKAQQEFRDKFDKVQTKDGDWVAFDKSNPKNVVPLVTPDGKPVSGKAAPKEGTPVLSNGVPVGLFRNGEPRFPYSKEWTGEDAKAFAAFTAGHTQSEAEKTKRLEISSKFRQTALQQAMLAQPWSGIDSTTGKAITISRSEAVAPENKGRYVATAEGDKIMKQQAGYAEIDATVNMVNEALAQPELKFDANTRAQLAAASRTPDPSSALHEFLSSEAADSLNESQINYVTAIASMYDSANRLINISGGQRATDAMRGAIRGMLPGPTGPNKKYAQKQMERFGVEMNTLRQGTPGLGDAPAIKPTSGAGGAAPANIVPFTVNGQIVDIPKDQVAAFKKKFPNATTTK